MVKISKNGTAYQFIGGADRPCIVLIHGLGLTQHMWQWHKDILGRDYSLLLYDLYGHGDSKPAPQPPSLSLFSEQLYHLLQDINSPKYALVGFSLGGMINRRFFLDYRDRLNMAQKLSAIAIFNSPHERAPDLQREVVARAKQVANDGASATMDAAIQRWFTKNFITNNPDIIALVRQWRKQVDTASYAGACRVLAEGVEELIRPPKAITTPCLIMTCENDSGSTPFMAKEMQKEMPNSEIMIVPILQHMGLVEQPHLFCNPLLDFFKRIHF